MNSFCRLRLNLYKESELLFHPIIIQQKQKKENVDVSEMQK